MLAILLAAGVGIQQFVQWQKEHGFKPIYSGLTAEDAGQVVQKLKESGVDYRLVEGGAVILVPEERVAELRLELANAGLPRSGRIGFELFDKTTFGATDFAEHVNFRRAVEGELERSVMSISEVEQARVHVTFPKESIYSEYRQPAKASVLVKLRTGSSLSPQSVVAITHLLSSAVEGLNPEQVSVLDMRGRLLNRPKRSGAASSQEATEATLEHQKQVEKDLLQKIESTLAPLLGEDKFRAAVSVECEINSGEQSEEIFDPTKSVMLSSQSSIESVGANPAGGQPGTATNLPNPPSASGRSGAPSRKTESTTFQTSRTVRRLTLSQGAIKNMSISVLLDQTVKWDQTPNGMSKVFVPPSPETLKVIRDLIAGVTGLKKERGDQLIVESLPFESTINAEAPAKPTAPPTGSVGGSQQIEQALRDPKILAGAGAAVLGVLGIVAFFFLRGRKKRAKSRVAIAARAEAAADSLRLAGTNLEPSKQDQLEAAPPERFVLIDSIRQEVESNPAVFAGVVQDWLIGPGGK